MRKLAGEGVVVPPLSFLWYLRILDMDNLVLKNLFDANVSDLENSKN
jgi:hypothetical protein